MAQSNAQRVAHTGGTGFFIIAAALYLAFVGLFLWQTAAFVNWLFPSDQIIYRVITVATFDIMAVLWACIDTFYRFATRGSHALVQWAWTISFIASLVASVFYMVLQSMTRLDFTPDITWIDVAYGIVILVTVLQILFLTFFIRGEWMTRHPKTNDYEYDVPSVVVRPEPIQAQTKVLTRRPATEQRVVKKLPPARKKLTRANVPAPITLVEEREIETGPLAVVPAPQPAPQTQQKTAQPRVQIRKKEKQYVVNPRPKLPVND